MTDGPKHRDFYTTSQAAEILSVAPDTVLKWAKAGKVKAHRTLGGHYRIPRNQILKLVPDLAASPLDVAATKLLTEEFCWQNHVAGDRDRHQCQSCVTYQSRAGRCYELRSLDDKMGCLRINCIGDCEDCGYFSQVRNRGTILLVVSRNRRVVADIETCNTDDDFEFRFVDNEYDCARIIEFYRPDFVVVDCALGKRRASFICSSLFNDPRLPIVRIILASNQKKDCDYCESQIFGWMKKPFTVAHIKDYIERAGSPQSL